MSVKLATHLLIRGGISKGVRPQAGWKTPLAGLVLAGCCSTPGGAAHCPHLSKQHRQQRDMVQTLPGCPGPLLGAVIECSKEVMEMGQGT